MNPEQKVFDPAAKGVKTYDGFDNFVSRLGLNNDNVLSAGAYVFNLMTRNRIQLEAAYRGSWIVGRVIESIAEDMTKAGVDITTAKADGDIKKLKSHFSRLGIWQSLCSMIKWGRLYGGAVAVLQIDGQDMSSPLDIERIAEGQFKGLVVYDRWQLNPVLDQVIRFGPETGLPKFYDIVTSSVNALPSAPMSMTGQIRVHHSRVIRNIGIELPFFQAITEMMWGESILERLWDRLISFDSATMSAANLIERACNRTIGIEGFREIMAAGGDALRGLTAQFEMMRTFQTNEGLTLIDKNDEFSTTQYTFSGLSDLLLQFGQQLSGASETPMVRLFGQSPAGLNATGEADMRMYYDTINAKQEADLRAGIDTVIRVMWRSIFGVAAPEDMEFTFIPLWQMSLKDKAEIGKLNTETVLAAEAAGCVPRSAAMMELRDMSGDTGLFSNISDEDISEAEELDSVPIPGELDPADPNAQPAVPEVKPQPAKAADGASVVAKLWAWIKRA